MKHLLFILTFSAGFLWSTAGWNTLPASGSEASEGPYFASRALFHPQNHQPQRLEEHASAGARFTSKTKFHRISVSCPSYGNHVGDLRLSLYVWRGTPEATRAEKPLARETFKDFLDNAHLSLSFAPLPPGEYYWELDGASEVVGVWKVPQSFPNVDSFLNGKRIDGAFEVFLERCDSSIPFSGPDSLYEKLAGPTIAPPETLFVSNPDGSLREGQKFEHRDLFTDTWDAIDGLGRRLGTSETLGLPRKKQVGIFYWTWHESFHTQTEPVSNAEILAKNPGIEKRPTDPKWLETSSRHHWDEPLFGYYRTTDPWVSRRHALLLSAAGVDAVVFDATNGTHTWMDSTWTLCQTWSAMRREGIKTPKFVFMLPFWMQKHQCQSLLQLYRDIYQPGKYSDLWYYWNGRPLIHAEPQVVENALLNGEFTPEERADLEKILRFFTFRPLQAAYAQGPATPNQWCWLEVYPQHGYVLKKDGTYEMCAAGVAQNHSWLASDGHAGLAAMNDQNVFGRAYIGPSESELKPGEKLRFAPDRNPRKDEPNRFIWGDNFAQQLDHAQEIDPDYLFVTGWNEWIAGLFPVWYGKKGAFPDQYSPEFSRDLEPSTGILQDHFYCQFVQGMRRFRGVRPQRAADEEPIYRDARLDTLPRKAQGYGSRVLENASGRCDIEECFVSHDEENLVFRVQCVDSIVPPTEPDWMRLFLSISLEENGQPHWNRFQYVVNRQPPQGDQAILEVCTANGWNWTEIAKVPMKLDGKTLEITIPRKLIQQSGKKIDVRFKWVDNVSLDGQERAILNFYVHGDAAPDGRFLYRYFER